MIRRLKVSVSDVKLSSIMFLQYMAYAVWGVSFSAYLSDIGISGLLLSLIISTPAIGAIFSPIICSVVERYFSANRALLFLNVTTSILVYIVSLQSNPVAIFSLMFIAMVLSMPAWSITNALVMRECELSKFPVIRVFGSIGWVASGLFSVAAVKMFNINIDGASGALVVGSGIYLLCAVVSYFLPYRAPVKDNSVLKIVDLLGLRTVTLFKDTNFAVFVIFSFLAMIPFSIYWAYYSIFLSEQGFKFVTLSMNLGQLGEIFFMLLVGLMAKRYGIKRVLLIGLTALVIRYFMFWLGIRINSELPFFIGILVHGLIYGMFFISGQMYVDRKSPKEYKMQAQGFITFITFGVGLIAGNFLNGVLLDQYSFISNGVLLYDWTNIWLITTIFSGVLVLSFALLFRDKIEL